MLLGCNWRANFDHFNEIQKGKNTAEHLICFEMQIYCLLNNIFLKNKSVSKGLPSSWQS